MSTYILGKAAHPVEGHTAKYIITNFKLRHISTNRFNTPREISTESCVLRLKKSVDQASQERCASHCMPVRRIGGCRSNLDQHFIVFRCRFFNLLQMQDIR